MLTVTIPCDKCSALNNTEYNFTEGDENIDPCSTYKFTVIATNVIGNGRTDMGSTIWSSFLKGMYNINYYIGTLKLDVCGYEHYYVIDACTNYNKHKCAIMD